MARNRFVIRIEAKRKGRRHVEFGDFIAELQAFHALLERADRKLSDGQTVVYEIVSLSHSSPATVIVEERPADRKYKHQTNIIPSVLSGLTLLYDEGVAPDYFDRPMLEKLKTIAAAPRKRGVVSRVQANGRELTFGKSFENKIDRLLREERNYLSSFEGRLEAINVHNNANVFYVYPAVGAKKVRCSFPKELLAQALTAITQHVAVRGRLFVHPEARYPHRIEVATLQVVPPDRVYPGFEDIQGLITDLPDDEPSEEVVGRTRDDWR